MNKQESVNQYNMQDLWPDCSLLEFRNCPLHSVLTELDNNSYQLISLNSTCTFST